MKQQHKYSTLPFTDHIGFVMKHQHKYSTQPFTDHIGIDLIFYYISIYYYIS